MPALDEKWRANLHTCFVMHSIWSFQTSHEAKWNITGKIDIVAPAGLGSGDGLRSPKARPHVTTIESACIFSASPKINRRVFPNTGAVEAWFCEQS